MPITFPDRPRPETEASPDALPACPFCRGSGVCVNCNGHGSHVVRRNLIGREVKATCIACESAGECRLCTGRGYVSG